MRQTYVVTYDIADPKRLRRVFRTLRGYGDHLQLSVFRCELNRRELVELRTKLAAAIHAADDQVLLVDIGPAEGRAVSCIKSLGRGYTHPEVHAIIA